MLATAKTFCFHALIFGFWLGRAAVAAEPEKVLPIIVQVCSGCHGMDGNSVIPTIPKLAGRHPEYLVKELKEFISGKRKSDVMGAIVTTIDVDDLKEIAAYFGRQKPTSEPLNDPAAAVIGKKLFLDGDEGRGVPACAGCHEEDGSGSKRFPRLAGQHRPYLVEQMSKFKHGVHDHPSARYMREVTRLLSDDEIKAVAEYLSAR